MSLDFINPYNFVRANGTPDRRRPDFHHMLAADTYSGELVCELEVKTRLLIPDSMSIETLDRPRDHKIFHDFAKRSGPNGQATYIIPAASLKGVVRSVAEALSNSCYSVLATSFDYESSGNTYQRKDFSAKLNTVTQLPCNSVENLCPTCRLFGMVVDQQDRSGRKKASGFRGRVMFEDAVERKVCLDDRQFFLQLSSPRPHNWRFYLTPEMEYLNYETAYADTEPTKIRGRKFFYHFEPNELDHPSFQDRRGPTRQNVTVKKTVLPDSIFGFKIAFTNLTKDELGLLLFALDLDPDLCHKIGMGKPVGFGSCKITINKASSHVFDSRERYCLQERSAEKHTSLDEIKKDYLDEIKKSDTIKESYDDLKAILRFDLERPVPVKYPSGRDQMDAVRQRVLGSTQQVEAGDYFVDPPAPAGHKTKGVYRGKKDSQAKSTIGEMTIRDSWRSGAKEKKKSTQIKRGTELVAIVQSIKDKMIHFSTKEGIPGQCEGKYGIPLRKGDKIKIKVTGVSQDVKTITTSTLIKKV